MIDNKNTLPIFSIIDILCNRIRNTVTDATKQKMLVENYNIMPSIANHNDKQIIVCVWADTLTAGDYDRNHINLTANINCDTFSLLGADADISSFEAAETLGRQVITHCYNEINNAVNLDLELENVLVQEFKPLQVINFDMADRIEAIRCISAYRYNFTLRFDAAIEKVKLGQIAKHNFNFVIQ